MIWLGQICWTAWNKGDYMIHVVGNYVLYIIVYCYTSSYHNKTFNYNTCLENNAITEFQKR